MLSRNNSFLMVSSSKPMAERVALSPTLSKRLRLITNNMPNNPISKDDVFLWLNTNAGRCTSLMTVANVYKIFLHHRYLSYLCVQF